MAEAINDPMSESPNFEKNLKAFGDKNPEVVELLQGIKDNPWQLCHTGTFHQINLKRSVQGQDFFVHSPLNAAAEASQWFNSVNLTNLEVIVLYGVGCGYYYQAAKPWLHAKANRRLIILEDDLYLLRRFLELDEATDLLADLQVGLYAYHPEYSPAFIDKIVKDIFLKNITITALFDYEQRRAQILSEINFKLLYTKQQVETANIEYLHSGKAFFVNYFSNALTFPRSYLTRGMRDHFKGVPAIICGAGPSLKKHFALLKELKDKALIFAGGSAMNVLNGNGIEPHFGIGLDPFPAQFTRLVMNTAYEVPFFYTNRMHQKALQMIHGPMLYVTNSGGYGIGPWMESKLHIEAPMIDAGANVVNFSVSLAQYLGCNPIIIVGVDLAYTDGLSYAPGIAGHAIHDPKDTLITKNPFEELLLRTDIYGKPIYTLWKWITESYWFTMFKLNNPQVTLINSTEGGIGFPLAPNLSLKDVADKYLTRSYDIQAWIHAVIQQSPMPDNVTDKEVLSLLEEIQKSLYAVLRKIDEFMVANKPADELSASLKDESSYQCILEDLDAKFMHFGHMLFASLEEDVEESQDLSMRIKFLTETCEIVLNYIRIAIVQASVLEKTPGAFPEANPGLLEESGVYRLDGDAMVIEEPLLGIAFKEKVIASDGDFASEGPWEGKICFHGPDGDILLEEYYKSGQLHGPSTTYGKKEKVLSKTWFVNGLRQGKARTFYGSGKLNSIQQYKDGVKEGPQVYLYPSGKLKSIIPYAEGVLDGAVYLYFPSGLLQREIHFAKGKRHGYDRVYYPTGIKMIEALYEEDKPVNIAREWHQDGKISREVTYLAPGQRELEKVWSSDGMEVIDYHEAKEDYFDRISRQIEVLTEAIETVLIQLRAASEPLEKLMGEHRHFQLEFNVLKEELENLKEATTSLLHLTGKKGDRCEEMIWKSPQMQKNLEQQVAMMTAKLRDAFNAMQSQIKALRNKLGINKSK